MHVFTLWIGASQNILRVPFVVSFYDFQNQVSHDLKFPTYPNVHYFVMGGGGGENPNLVKNHLTLQ